jgi:L-lactate permease
LDLYSIFYHFKDVLIKQQVLDNFRPYKAITGFITNDNLQQASNCLNLNYNLKFKKTYTIYNSNILKVKFLKKVKAKKKPNKKKTSLFLKVTKLLKVNIFKNKLLHVFKKSLKRK